MEKHIIRRQLKEEAESKLHEVHPLLRQLYSSRKLNDPIQLDRQLMRLLPFESLLGIDTAVKILALAVTANKKLLVVGDFDADGATSTAVAVRALKSFGAEHVTYLVPNRFSYGYGLTKELVESITDLPHIILTVDNGIANHAGVDAANERGIEVVITDHHLQGLTLPAAAAIVNPNQAADPFISKNLAGVGVVFYVMLALRRYLVEIKWFETRKIAPPNMARLLDLVALGTVADLVPLDHNNRILVHQGLQRIRAGLCVPGIVALLECSNRDFTRVTASDLGFVVASRLNAAGRLDDMSQGIECLLCDDSLIARQYARKLDQLNHERREIEVDMQTQAMHALEKLSSKLKGELPKGLCLYDESWHQGVIGILAARIKEKFHRPVIVMAPGQHGELKGSARSIPGFHMRDAFAVIDAQYPRLIKKFGGHAMAAGLTIDQTSYAQFAEIFSVTVADLIAEEDLQHSILSDGELALNYLNLETAHLLREAGPWGQAFPEPLFDDAFQLVEQRIVADKHLKLILGKEDKLIDAMAFFVDIKQWPNHRCQRVQAAYRLDVNEYRGKKNLQLIIEHLLPLS
ncbi:MAG: single-stranded-DNA-specific exonuclease RecJ [Gammaproteobacteria bacterium]|nr:single-stranded-DNA-specific exonuclease RecJ [Gammaproteobacteria bacterium]